jgi:poly(A) polymerase
MTDPRIIPRPDHPISRQDIDRDTLRVLYQLKDSGYQAYLVGGAVRDLLMGRRPKDFDVATDARPRDLRRLFRNSREVGRRFRIVHVFFGHKNVEVATLRSQAEPSGDDLYVEDDNQWGTLETDAFRRDFTVNALYYDIRDFAVIDYTGGIADLERKVVRAIGDPWVRFGEDPVRMMRAVKFSARFGYTLDPDTEAAARDQAPDILKASRFRVTEEFFRIIAQTGRAEGLRLLADLGLLGALYPDWLDALGDEGWAQVIDYFHAVDRAGHEERFFPLEVLAAGLFVPLLGEVDLGRQHFDQVAARVTAEVRELGMRMDLPKRLINSIVDLLRAQLYLLFFHHQPKRVRRLIEHPVFDQAWRVHELAFGGITELDGVRELWLAARRTLRRPLGGLVETPDRRDIFSFRGKTGGGRLPNHRGGRGGRGGDEDDGQFEESAIDAVE